jgi:CRP-like cAMP-binding protein
MGLDQDIELLEEVPTLQLLGREALRILAISAQGVQVPGGDTLYREGEQADGAYVVVDGSVALQRERGTDARETVIARRGALLGETALLVDTVWTGTATAIENTRLLRIPRTVFLRMLEGEEEAAQNLRQHLAERLGRTIDEIDSVRPRFEVEGDEEEDDEFEKSADRPPR